MVFVVCEAFVHLRARDIREAACRNRIYGLAVLQQPDYIVHALSAYKSGARKDPIMGAMGANLSRQDMQDLAAYFSSQNGLVVKY